MLDYDVHARKSMFNTPPVFSVYVVNETLKWIDKLGGIGTIEKINARKAKKLYVEIDRNSIFRSTVHSDDRSMMNIYHLYLMMLIWMKAHFLNSVREGALYP